MTDTRRDVAAEWLRRYWCSAKGFDSHKALPEDSAFHEDADELLAVLRSEGREPDAWIVAVERDGVLDVACDPDSGSLVFASKAEADPAAELMAQIGRMPRYGRVYFGTPSDSPTGERETTITCHACADTGFDPEDRACLCPEMCEAARRHAPTLTQHTRRRPRPRRRASDSP